MRRFFSLILALDILFACSFANLDTEDGSLSSAKGIIDSNLSKLGILEHSTKKVSEKDAMGKEADVNKEKREYFFGEHVEKELEQNRLAHAQRGMADISIGNLWNKVVGGKLVENVERKYAYRPKTTRYQCIKYLEPEITSIDISEGCGGPSYRNDFDGACHGHHEKSQGVTQEEWDEYLKEIANFKAQYGHQTSHMHFHRLAYPSAEIIEMEGSSLPSVYKVIGYSTVAYGRSNWSCTFKMRYKKVEMYDKVFMTGDAKTGEIHSAVIKDKIVSAKGFGASILDKWVVEGKAIRMYDEAKLILDQKRKKEKMNVERHVWEIHHLYDCFPDIENEVKKEAAFGWEIDREKEITSEIVHTEVDEEGTTLHLYREKVPLIRKTLNSPPREYDNSGVNLNIETRKSENENKGWMQSLVMFLMGFAALDAMQVDDTLRQTITSMDPKDIRIFGGKESICGQKEIKMMGIDWLDCCGENPVGLKQKLVNFFGFGKLCTPGSQQTVIAKRKGNTLKAFDRTLKGSFWGGRATEHRQYFVDYGNWLNRWIVDFARYDLANQGVIERREPYKEIDIYKIDKKTGEKKKISTIKKVDAEGLTISQMERVDFDFEGDREKEKMVDELKERIMDPINGDENRKIKDEIHKASKGTVTKNLAKSAAKRKKNTDNLIAKAKDQGLCTTKKEEQRMVNVIEDAVIQEMEQKFDLLGGANNVAFTASHHDLEKSAIKLYADLQGEDPKKAVQKKAAEYSSKGLQSRKQGQEREAEEFYKKSINLDSKKPSTYYALGALYVETGKEKDAEECYKKTIGIDPKDANAQYNIGVLRHKTGQEKDAEEYYKKAIEINPRHAFAYSNLGAVYSKQGKDKEAEKCLKKALELDPGGERTHRQLSFLYSKQGKEKEAQMALRKAKELEKK